MDSTTTVFAGAAKQVRMLASGGKTNVPLAPHDDGWQELIVNGPITRTVEDAALFLDVTTMTPLRDGGFVAAAARTRSQRCRTPNDWNRGHGRWRER
jgi:hypothetical protein